MSKSRKGGALLGISALSAAAVLGALWWGNRKLIKWESLEAEDYAEGQFCALPNGWRIHYTVRGEGEPVVLLHGFMDSIQSWRKNIGALAINHRVYAIDALGFGASERVVEPIYSLKRGASLLHQFFDTLSIPRATIIGHSMGGALALQFAYDFPARVHKLVLIAPATYYYANWPRRGFASIPRWLARGAMGLQTMAPPMFQTGMANAYGDAAMLDDESVSLRLRTRQVRGSADALLSMTISPRETDLPQGLSDINAPSLIVWGARDRVLPVADSRRHVEALPNAELRIVETAGHLPHEESPYQVNEWFAEFLNDDGPGTK